MPPRDPQKSQLDFPDLIQDLINQLRLTGQGLGLLDFLPSVQPVYLVANRAGASLGSFSPPIAGSGDVFDGELGPAPAAALICDTGQLAAGTFDIYGHIARSGTAAANGSAHLQHRNAANAATLAVLDQICWTTAAQSMESSFSLLGYEIATNERIRYFNNVTFTGIVSATIVAIARVQP